MFATTHWSVVLMAARDDTPRAQPALEHLCRLYWYPLYAFARRRGCSPPDAQDLTQAFFARLLEKNWVGDADRNRGKFRTFLLTAMSRFLAGEWDKVRAQKRGGGMTFLPLQGDGAETRYALEPADSSTPEQAFERRWALALLESVLRQLQAEYDDEGNGKLFAVLGPALLGGRDKQPYAAMAGQLGLQEGATRVAVHRLRKRYRHLLRSEIARTMAETDNVDEELRHLFAVLSKR